MDRIKNSGLASGFNSSVANSQHRSNRLPPKDGKFPARELQEQYQGKSKDIVPLPF
jgi:hypothetical protein